MRYYVVDAFTDKLFSGNPAGVCLVEKPLEDGEMQKIAAENNLSETAFLERWGSGTYGLRWFTPTVEMDLCGHATLASAFVVSRFVDIQREVFLFHTRSGLLTVTERGDFLEMILPAWKPESVEIPAFAETALGVQPLEAHKTRDLLLLLESAEQVRDLQPDFALLKRESENYHAVIVTAEGDGADADFVSRFFAPGAGVNEDPVTGSAHASLVPFWAQRLGKKEMTAWQLSKRGGVLYCEDCGDSVKVSGQARLYLTGEIQV